MMNVPCSPLSPFLLLGRSRPRWAASPSVTILEWRDTTILRFGTARRGGETPSAPPLRFGKGARGGLQTDSETSSPFQDTGLYSASANSSKATRSPTYSNPLILTRWG